MMILTCCLALIARATAQPQATATSIPLVRGLTIISALKFPEGDRENVVVVQDSAADGVTYTWRFRERRADGTEHTAEFTRLVRLADLRSAARLGTVFTTGSTQSPGFTAFSISTATYDNVSAGTTVPFAYTALEGSGELGKVLGRAGELFVNRFVMRGTLERVSTEPQPLPLLIDGRRVSAPAWHLKGRFVFQDKRLEPDLWVLADRMHPLLLRIVTGSDVLQVVKVERPGAVAAVEQALSTQCVGELAGIHFAFGSATLEPTSAPALAAIAQTLERHTDWSITIEGHTDNVGNAPANADLSRRRAEAVREALVTRHRVNPTRLTAAGYGASRPRESNATLEGRARNRRVELVRPCASRPSTDDRTPI